MRVGGRQLQKSTRKLLRMMYFTDYSNGFKDVHQNSPNCTL